MTNKRLNDSVNETIDQLRIIQPEVLRAINTDRNFSLVIKPRVLGLVDRLLVTNKEITLSPDYDRKYGEQILSAILPMTHSLSVLNAMAIYGEDLSVRQSYADFTWSIGNCIRELNKLTGERAKGY